jgi:HK97 gp10 family phage protein
MTFSGIEVRGRSGVVANLYARFDAIGEEIRQVVREEGETVKALAVEGAPKDTGFMASKVALEMSPDDLVFRVGLKPEDFLGAGKTFYPWFVHEGTVHMPARPFLFNAYEQRRLPFTQRVGDAIRGAVNG